MVSARDPEAVYVSLIPRESFAKVKLTMSSDLLLLRSDPLKGELLLEGDSDRYQIPADSIGDCEPQCFFHPADVHRQSELWMARLTIQTQQGKRELLLSRNHTNFRPRRSLGRRQAAEELCQRILALQSS